MRVEKYKLTERDKEKIVPKVERLKEFGYGRVQILVKDHKVYRTLYTEDELEEK